MLTALAVQVLLWFSLKAIGVSVVWSAMAGYDLMELTFSRGTARKAHQNLLIVAVSSAGGGIVYYALTLPAITTVAHGIAVVMGVGLFFLFRAISTKHQQSQDDIAA